MLSNYWLNVIHFALINALLGLSIYFPLSAGQFSLASGGFAAIGGYTSALLVLKAGWPLPLAWAAAGLIPAAVAGLIGIPALRLRGVHLAIATLAFGEIVRVSLMNWPFAGGTQGLRGIPSHSLALRRWLQSILAEPPGEMSFSQAGNLAALLITLALVGLVVVFAERLRHSRTGRAFAAMKADEVAAGAQAIDTTRYGLQAFSLGAAVAGLAGAVFAHLATYIGPAEYGFGRTVEMLLYAVLGGMNVPLGPVLGAGLVSGLLEGLRDAAIGALRLADWRLVIYGLLMMTIVLVRPQGLLRARRTSPQLFKRDGAKGRTAA